MGARDRISEEERLLRRNRLGLPHARIYKVRVKWTGDQERIEAQARMLGFKENAEEYIFRCALLVTERLEAWRELCAEDDR